MVDYKAADTVEKLRKLGPYKYLFTASGDPTSQQALASLLPDGGRFASVLGGDVELPSNVERVYKPFSQAAQLDENHEWRDWWYKESHRFCQLHKGRRWSRSFATSEHGCV